MTQPMFSGSLAFASNFYEMPFYVPELGLYAASGEHAFNAMKTTDPDQLRAVLDAPTPKASKAIGRKVTLRPGWDTGMRVLAMQRIVDAKFTRTNIGGLLTATGDLVLVETNFWHDQFWGDCTCERHADAPGRNMLGELLMAQRELIKMRAAVAA